MRFPAKINCTINWAYLTLLDQGKRRSGHNDHHHHSAPHGLAVALAGDCDVVAADAEEDVDSESDEPEVRALCYIDG